MELANYIDHTLLKAEATLEDIQQLCMEAMEYQFYSVCVNPYWVKIAKNVLKDSPVSVCTVVGFPLGATPSAVKVSETELAIKDGADEIDMVMNIGAFKSGQYEDVLQDIKAVVTTASTRALVKVIIETSLLTDKEIRIASELAEKAGAHFVKTSTGFSTGGARPEHIQLMKESLSQHIGIKASGGIRTSTDAKRFIEAGATRIGASASVEIIKS